MKKKIVVSLQVEGVHCWPECPIEGVAFLKDPHRHMFYIKAKKEVNHNDRDIEIIELKRELTSYLMVNYSSNFQTCNFGRKSCEDIAEELAVAYKLDYCSVLEDDENGAEVSQE